MILWAAVGWFACAVALSRSAPAFAEPEHQPRSLVSVEVRGEPEWQKGELNVLLEEFLSQNWNSDTEARIRSAIQATARYREVELTPRTEDGGVRLLVSVKPKLLVSRVVFHGQRSFSLRELERTARLPVGTALDDKVLASSEQRLSALYRNNGFPEVAVRVEAKPCDPESAAVHIWIHEGRPQTITTIEWFGADITDPQAFLRALPVRSGERWTARSAKEVEKAAVRYLREQGYLEARATADFVETSSISGTLRLALRPGPRCEIVVEGNRRVSKDQILAAARLKERLLITDGTWRQLARVAKQLYQERGHYLVAVRLSVERSDPDKKRIRLVIDEGPLLTIRRVTFEGRQRVSEKKLLEVMSTGPRSWFPRRHGFLVPSRFEEDLRRLWFRYREFGFVDAEITDYRIDIDRSEGRIDVTIVVDEGLPVVTAQLDFAGLPEGIRRPALQEIRLRRAFDPFALEREAERVARYLRDAGYADATVTGTWRIIEEQALQRLAAVTFEVNPGALQRVGEIRVRGNLQVHSSVVRRESQLKPDAPLTPQSLANAQTRLYQLGLFRGVFVDALEPFETAKTSGEIPRDVVVQVQERPPLSVSFGGGYNTRDGFRAFGEIAHINLRHRGERLGLRGDIALDPAQATAPNEYLVDLGFRDPQFWETSWTLRTNVIGQRATRSVDQFSIERLALVPALERRWRSALLTGVEFQWEQARIFDLRPDARVFNPADEGQLRTGGVGPFLVYEGRDDPFMPHRGVFESVRFRLAAGFLGSDEPLAKLQWHHSHYVPLGESLTWLYALRAGWARTFSGAVVPIRERFFLGGRSTVRGFSENSIGPQGAPIVDALGKRVFPGGNPLGGDLSLNVNTELRFPLVWGAIGVAFVDAGGVYLQDRSISLEDFRRSAGMGLLYETPVGPLALHYGIKLDRRRGEAFGAVHFTIGTLF
ncbi:MAG: BamA/TamA family outer membrane protein [Candidatus Binatia bacterium]|nr:BamA/TamA family outer membrane protein [Candidatus Binatia bacterium]